MSLSNPNLPKLVVSLRQYTANMFLHDLLAGITVGLVALPLAMAFGIASGVTPQAGLYTAVVAGFLISALGGSRTQMIGQTLWTEFFSNRDWPVASALAVMLLMVLLVPILFYERVQRRAIEGEV